MQGLVEHGSMHPRTWMHARWVHGWEGVHGGQQARVATSGRPGRQDGMRPFLADGVALALVGTAEKARAPRATRRGCSARAARSQPGCALLRCSYRAKRRGRQRPRVWLPLTPGARAGRGAAGAGGERARRPREHAAAARRGALRGRPLSGVPRGAPGRACALLRDPACCRPGCPQRTGAHRVAPGRRSAEHERERARERPQSGRAWQAAPALVRALAALERRQPAPRLTEPVAAFLRALGARARGPALRWALRHCDAWCAAGLRGRPQQRGVGGRRACWAAALRPPARMRAARAPPAAPPAARAGLCGRGRRAGAGARAGRCATCSRGCWPPRRPARRPRWCAARSR